VKSRFKLKIKESYLAIGCGLTLLIFNPFQSYSPISLPKSAAIAFLAFVALGKIELKPWKEINKREKRFYLLTISFLLSVFIPFFFSGTHLLRQFYGREERSFGLLTIVCLLIILIAAFQSSGTNSIFLFRDSLIACGVLISFYALLQLNGIDFIEWDNLNKITVGTLGNTNYFSAFMGFASIALISRISNFSTFRNGIRNFLLISNLILNLYLISKSNSVQGYYLISSGVITYFLLWLYNQKIHLIYKIGILTSLLASLTLVFFGIFNKGFLSSILYQQSTSFRTDFWKTGIQIFKSHWLTGVGLDNYGDYYRRERSLEAIQNQGFDGVSQSAHNLLLDFATNGGIFLLLNLLFFIALVLTSVISLCKSHSQLNSEVAFLGAIWIAFLAQASISVNQISLSLIGWITAGYLLGMDASKSLSRISFKAPAKKLRVPVRSSDQIILKRFPVLYLATSIFVLLAAFQPLRSDYLFVKAVKSKKVSSILEASDSFPRLENHYIRSAQILLNNGVLIQANEMALKAIEVAPNSLEAWKVVYEISIDIDDAKANILRIEPNFDFKSG
jgi:O-antigen ligase